MECFSCLLRCFAGGTGRGLSGSTRLTAVGAAIGMLPLLQVSCLDWLDGCHCCNSFVDGCYILSHFCSCAFLVLCHGCCHEGLLSVVFSTIGAILFHFVAQLWLLVVLLMLQTFNFGAVVSGCCYVPVICCCVVRILFNRAVVFAFLLFFFVC